jgi:hypothetical protein
MIAPILYNDYLSIVFLIHLIIMTIKLALSSFIDFNFHVNVSQSLIFTLILPFIRLYYLS